ncbi:hypothetical protein LY474_08675 [Myxococcus stipitatus]|uniref:hypothetical protein n=1 Tax=Myxococcus stipitatus TaxID=83455 RepID=UPI001F3BFC09|nr:hypothetical protein [Myxococcus stipitatus]MCE9667882.1 hypothetical protein [Myxococcus stipitatus]
MPEHFVDFAHLARCADEELARWVEQADFSGFVAARDLAPLRERLSRLEREQGVTELHRRVSEKVLAVGARLMETPRFSGRMHAAALSPCGRYLALGSDRDESFRGCVIRIWELATGQVVDEVGFEDTLMTMRRLPSSSLQWSPSGTWIGVVVDCAAVSVMRAFAGTRPSFTVEVTRRWGSPPPWGVKNPEHVVNEGHPPAWCWSPDEKFLFISTRGPDAARGCIVPFVEGTVLDEDSEGLRWCPARFEGRHSGTYPLTWVRWSPDGARVFGHCKDSCDWWDSASNRHEYFDFVSVTDLGSGDLQFASEELKFPMAFSPDGALLALGGKKLLLVDGRTGRTVAELGEQLAPCEPEVELLAWSPDGRRLAVVSNGGHHPDDDDDGAPPLDHAHPAIFIFEEGRLRFRLKAESSWSDSRRHRDAWGWAWSPDGSRAAFLMNNDRIMVWELGDAPMLLRCLERVGRIDGLLWGAGDTLVGLAEQEVAFWDVSTGQLRAHHVFEAVVGRASPPESWCPSPDDDVRSLPTPEGWAFTRVRPDGTVVCPPEARELLAPRLMFAVEGRQAWPWRWAVGTRHTRLEDWPLRAGASAAEQVAPFAEHRIAVPEGETRRQATIRRVKKGPLEQYHYPTLPFSHYRADPVFMSRDLLHSEDLEPYVGQVMLVCEYGVVDRYFTATLLRVTDKGVLLHDGAPGANVSQEVRPFHSFSWIGPAVPLRGP